MPHLTTFPSFCVATHTTFRGSPFTALLAGFMALFLVLAAPADDCNNNGVDDCADIDAGLEDSDNDGVLDSCERATGDINLDGVVDGNDLGVVIGAWGPTEHGLVPPCDQVPIVPSWATAIAGGGHADPAIVTNAALRSAINATGWAWRVKATQTGVEMLLIPPGTYMMGCNQGSTFCGSGEEPVHQVTLTAPFYIGRYELTQDQWTVTMGSNPSFFHWGRTALVSPVEQVSWDTVQGFLAKTGMRLPTEAEWEFAYRAGTTTSFHSLPGYPNGTNNLELVPQIAWCYVNSPDSTRVVGELAGNGFGLHDMGGNVFEWVHDRYGAYPATPQTNPTGPTDGKERVTRGGTYALPPEFCSASQRMPSVPILSDASIGFRVARNP